MDLGAKGAGSQQKKLFAGVSIALGAALALANIFMLRDALVNGPTWYQDYTLAGMQYGARQLFGAVKDYIAQHPDAQLIVSPSWTNGADAVAEFFLPRAKSEAGKHRRTFIPTPAFR